MALHIIVDGYNLIRQSPALLACEREGLARGREALLARLAAYRRLKPHRITVVFDGGAAPAFSPPRDRLQGIAVIYSRPGETADSVILRLAAQERERALVVSSDRAVMRQAAASGAAAVDSPEFEARMRLAAALDGAEPDGEAPAERRITTRKKGAGRRLPRRRRRIGRKAAKL
jgi:hypothetical protein